jgi:hypothetical protein
MQRYKNTKKNKINFQVPPHAYFADGPIKKILIDVEQYILYLEVIVAQTETKTKLQPVLWQPRWESFGGVDSDKVSSFVVFSSLIDFRNGNIMSKFSNKRK